MTKQQSVLLILLVSVMALCPSCRSSLAGAFAVERLQNGMLNHFNNTTTVRQAFEGTFQNAKWSSFKTPSGRAIIQFDGTITYARLFGTVTLDKFERVISHYEPPFSPAEFASVYEGCVSSVSYRDELADAYNDWITLKADGADLVDAAADIQKAWPTFKAIATKLTTCINRTPIPVMFRFTLSADQNTFEVIHVDKRFHTLPEALAFVYP